MAGGAVLRNQPEELEFAELDDAGERIPIGDDFKVEKKKFRFFNGHVQEIVKHFNGQAGFSRAMQEDPFSAAQYVFCVVFGWSEAVAMERMLEGCIQEYGEAIGVCWSRWGGVSEVEIERQREMRKRAEKKALERAEELLEPALDATVTEVMEKEIRLVLESEMTPASARQANSTGNTSSESGIEQPLELVPSLSSGD